MYCIIFISVLTVTSKCNGLATPSSARRYPGPEIKHRFQQPPLIIKLATMAQCGQTAMPRSLPHPPHPPTPLTHPRSGDFQGQKMFLATSSNNHTCNQNTKYSNFYRSSSPVRSKGLSRRFFFIHTKTHYNGHLNKMKKTKAKIHVTVIRCKATLRPEIKLKEEQLQNE